MVEPFKRSLPYGGQQKIDWPNKEAQNKTTNPNVQPKRPCIIKNKKHVQDDRDPVHTQDVAASAKALALEE